MSKDIHAKLIVTTSWDDGHKLDIRLANLLEKYNIKGTFYISPFDREFSRKDLLTSKQIMQVAKKFEIGAHTMTHPVLTKIPLAEAEKEIADSRTYLRKLTKQQVNNFCYPRGAYNKALMQAVQRAGFRSARTVRRHEWNIKPNAFEYGTTIHCYRHYSDVHKIAAFSRFHPVKFLRNMNWETLAKKMFDEALTKGGVFHLWGHSWEIDKNNDWERLERVLAYIANNKQVTYCTNNEALNKTSTKKKSVSA